jgi:hypothetical protein
MLQNCSLLKDHGMNATKHSLLTLTLLTGFTLATTQNADAQKSKSKNEMEQFVKDSAQKTDGAETYLLKHLPHKDIGKFIKAKNKAADKETPVIVVVWTHSQNDSLYLDTKEILDRLQKQGYATTLVYGAPDPERYREGDPNSQRFATPYLENAKIEILVGDDVFIEISDVTKADGTPDTRVARHDGGPLPNPSVDYAAAITEGVKAATRHAGRTPKPANDRPAPQQP